MAFSINVCPLKMQRQLASLVMLNETFSVILKHRVFVVHAFVNCNGRILFVVTPFSCFKVKYAHSAFGVIVERLRYQIDILPFHEALQNLQNSFYQSFTFRTYECETNSYILAIQAFPADIIFSCWQIGFQCWSLVREYLR